MLLFAVLSLCAPLPASAQGTASVQTEVVDSVLTYCESRLGFDPTDSEVGDGQYLVLDALDRPTVAQGSLEYAAALLMAGRDADLAAKVIGSVLSHQQGGFPWIPDASSSPEATTHVAPWLAYIHANFGESLPADLRAQLEASLQPALDSASKLKVKSRETSRFLMKTAAIATLEAQLGTTGKAEAELAKWTTYTQQNGIPQLHSSGQMAVAIAALNWIWMAGLSDTIAADAASALDYIHRDMALRLDLSSGMVGGAAVQSARRDYAMALGASRYVLRDLFGQPSVELIPPFGLFVALPGYEASEETRRLALDADTPREQFDQSGDATFSTFVGPGFSLGTMTGPTAWDTAPLVVTYPEFDVAWDEKTDDDETVQRQAKVARNLYCDIRPASGRVASVQSGPKAILSFDFDQIGAEEARTDVFMDIKLGPEAAIDAVYLNLSPYSVDFGADVPSKSSVVTERGGVYTAITVIEMGPATRRAGVDPASLRGVLGWVPTGDATLGRELVLRLPARTKLGVEKPRDDYRIAFAVEVGDAETFGSVATFARHIYETRVRKELKKTHTKIGTKDERSNQVPGIRRPTERAKWIFDDAVLQELQYQSGPDLLVLNEDLAKNEVLSQSVNGTELAWEALYASPLLNHLPGDALTSVLRPPPAEIVAE